MPALVRTLATYSSMGELGGYSFVGAGSIGLLGHVAVGCCVRVGWSVKWVFEFWRVLTVAIPPAI